MKSLILALTLINASPEEQDLMLADMYDADPRLAYEVLDVADGLGADTDELAIVIAIIADSKNPDDWKCRNYYSTKELVIEGTFPDGNHRAVEPPGVGSLIEYEPVKYHKGF